LGARVTPHFAILGRMQYQEYSTTAFEPQGSGARGADLGFELVIHPSPYERVDPWLSLGSGYRWFWSTRPQFPNEGAQGFEIGRVALGLDLRASRMSAIGPVVGVDVDSFMWRDVGLGNRVIADPRPSAYLFIGLQGKVDVGSYQRVITTTARNY